METKDIIHNLNAAAVSKHGIHNWLLLDIDAALKERDELRALLSSIQDAAECMPVPGGYAYTIDGRVMGQIDKALGEK